MNMDNKYSQRDVVLIMICLAVYLTSLIASNTLGIKLMPFIFGTHLSVSIFWFPFVFIGTDVVGEVFGKKVAKGFVFAGIICTALFILYMFVSSVLPWSEAASWAEKSYGTIFSVSLRIAIASLLAFAIGEYQDYFVFWKATSKIGQKMFWLRSLISNIWSQALDTAIFMIVAFAGIYSPYHLLMISIAWWAYKVLMSFLYTPMSYGAIKLLRKYKDNEKAQPAQI
jgi:uncharacterized integral membrane protein (TIGR00697 family)